MRTATGLAAQAFATARAASGFGLDSVMMKLLERAATMPAIVSAYVSRLAVKRKGPAERASRAIASWLHRLRPGLGPGGDRDPHRLAVLAGEVGEHRLDEARKHDVEPVR